MAHIVCEKCNHTFDSSNWRTWVSPLRAVWYGVIGAFGFSFGFVIFTGGFSLLLLPITLVAFPMFMMLRFRVMRRCPECGEFCFIGDERKS